MWRKFVTLIGLLLNLIFEPIFSINYFFVLLLLPAIFFFDYFFHRSFFPSAFFSSAFFSIGHFFFGYFFHLPFFPSAFCSIGLFSIDLFFVLPFFPAIFFSAFFHQLFFPSAFFSFSLFSIRHSVVRPFFPAIFYFGFFFFGFFSRPFFPDTPRVILSTVPREEVLGMLPAHELYLLLTSDTRGKCTRIHKFQYNMSFAAVTLTTLLGEAEKEKPERVSLSESESDGQVRYSYFIYIYIRISLPSCTGVSPVSSIHTVHQQCILTHFASSLYPSFSSSHFSFDVFSRSFAFFSLRRSRKILKVEPNERWSLDIIAFVSFEVTICFLSA